MSATAKVEVAVDLDERDRRRLDRVDELERKIDMLEAKVAASPASSKEEAVYLSPKKFAKRWDVSERLVREWLADDSFPAESCGARLVRIPVVEADEWVRSRR